MNTNEFLPEGHEVPRGESKYMKFEQGNNKFRFLDKPIFGWEAWIVEDGKDKPVRFRFDEKPVDLREFKRQEVKYFWAMPVWNFQTQAVEVLELTQKTIIKPIEALARNEDWGSPLHYNITVNKEGTTKEDTSYIVNPSPHSEAPVEARDQFKQLQAEGFDISRLYDGGDPFAPADTPDVAPEDVPFD